MRLSGTKVTRPPLELFRYLMMVVDVASLSTTTLNSWLPAVTSTAAFICSMQLNSSTSGPYTPLARTDRFAHHDETNQLRTRAELRTSFCKSCTSGQTMYSKQLKPPRCRVCNVLEAWTACRRGRTVAGRHDALDVVLLDDAPDGVEAPLDVAGHRFLHLRLPLAHLLLQLLLLPTRTQCMQGQQPLWRTHSLATKAAIALFTKALAGEMLRADRYESSTGCSLPDAALVAPQIAALVLHRVAALQQRRLLRLDSRQALLLPLDAGVCVAQTLRVNAPTTGRGNTSAACSNQAFAHTTMASTIVASVTSQYVSRSARACLSNTQLKTRLFPDETAERGGATHLR